MRDGRAKAYRGSERGGGGSGGSGSSRRSSSRSRSRSRSRSAAAAAAAVVVLRAGVGLPTAFGQLGSWFQGLRFRVEGLHFNFFSFFNEPHPSVTNLSSFSEDVT